MLAPATASHAQSRPIQIGAETGAAFTTFVGRDAELARSRTSPFAGITLVSHAPGAVVGFQSGLQLVSKGVSIDEDGLRGSFRLRYIELPLLLRFARAAQGAGLVPAITAGAMLGARIGCTITAEDENISGSFDCDEQIVGETVDFKRFEAGVSIGAEVAIPFRTRYLVIPMVRYTRGLTKIGDSETRDDVRNSVIQLGLGLRFRR